MPDSLALSAVAVVAAGLIALAMVWPQGQGARSPAPFGHPLAAYEPPLSLSHPEPSFAIHPPRRPDADDRRL
jgi:hypothetical protein